LSDILEDLINEIKHYDIDSYDKYAMCIYKMAYGDELDEDLAKEIVHRMKPYGERWSMQETEKLQRDYDLNNIRSEDFYVVMNQGYNDFREIFGDDLSIYLKYTKAFIEDQDAKEGKVFRYFTTIPK
jgi:hypothetical protein